MRPPGWLRTLTPWGWAAAATCLLGAIMIILQGTGFRWDPLGLAERRMKAADVRASTALADAAARRLEVEGAAAQTRRYEEFHQQAVAVAATTAAATTKAGRAHDAELPLEQDRAARLAVHDRELCQYAPAICGAAAAEPSRGGGEAVPAGTVAGGPDPRRP